MSTSVSGTGTLRIEAETPCDVYLDGDLIATLDSGEIKALDLLPNSYTLSAEFKSGGQRQETVTIEANTETTLSLSQEDTPATSLESASGESGSTIIRPGQNSEDESSGRSWFWTIILVLGVATIAVYGLRPQWTRPVTEYAQQVVETFRSTDAFTTKEDTPVRIQISSDSIAPASVTLLKPPRHGSLEFTEDSTQATYRPDLNYAGTDQFRYVLRKSTRRDTVSATVEITPVTDPPRAVDDRASTDAGTPVSITPLENDRSPDSDSVYLQHVDSASAGTVTIASDSTGFTYTPKNGFAGTDQVGYVISDERGATDSAVVAIQVDTPPPTPADLDLEWQRISAGTFVMGSDQGTEDAQPSHRVEITTPFRMSTHEVTVRQFRLFVEATGYTTDAERLGGAWRAKNSDSLRTPGLTWRNPGFEQSPDHPVVCVSWNDAQAFADWIGGRLPTEAEWEYAARAGVTYPKLSGEWKRTTWYAENSGGHTHPVGQKEPNNWGLYDVQGNAWEWVQDWYSPDYYERSPTKDPEGPESGELRVCRGGSWYNQTCWLPSRNRASPTYRANNIGFRVVKPVQSTSAN
jgi:formylglycine-generating enzyme required for sulfatase activity